MVLGKIRELFPTIPVGPCTEVTKVGRGGVVVRTREFEPGFSLN